MSPEARSRKLTVMMSDLELNMLRALAERDGFTLSEWVRFTARRAYFDAFGKQPPRPEQDR